MGVNLKRKERERFLDGKKEILRMHKEGATYRQIREKLKVGNGTITNVIRNANLIQK